jgi:hypothetical protein
MLYQHASPHVVITQKKSVTFTAVITSNLPEGVSQKEVSHTLSEKDRVTEEHKGRRKKTERKY